MEELRKRYFERLNNFKKNSSGVSEEVINFRYGELYGFIESMVILRMISFDEYMSLTNELDKLYDNTI